MIPLWVLFSIKHTNEKASCTRILKNQQTGYKIVRQLKQHDYEQLISKHCYLDMVWEQTMTRIRVITIPFFFFSNLHLKVCGYKLSYPSNSEYQASFGAFWFWSKCELLYIQPFLAVFIPANYPFESKRWTGDTLYSPPFMDTQYPVEVFLFLSHSIRFSQQRTQL